MNRRAPLVVRETKKAARGNSHSDAERHGHANTLPRNLLATAAIRATATAAESNSN